MDQPKYWMEFSPLHTACVYGHFEIVKLIYHFNTDFNRPMKYHKIHNSDGYETPIFVIVSCFPANSVNLLLKHLPFIHLFPGQEVR